ncbi:MAG TPA: hypothetical protein VJ824_13635 [Bacillota bacterium]|nr:hypothetical protein [Bacillota bacterium]
MSQSNQAMAKRSEIKVYEENVLGSRNAFWYHDYISLVQKLEKQDPTLLEPGNMTKEQLKKKMAGFIAYR